MVKDGDALSVGAQLAAGYLDPKDILKIKGIVEAQRYIIQEIQKIYVSQGAIIHDKHIEVIVRQMFSRIKIKNPGDSSFVPDETRGRQGNPF